MALPMCYKLAVSELLTQNVIRNWHRNGVVTVQIREMSRVKIRSTHPGYWLPRKTRSLYEQDLTYENDKFLKQVVHEQYGPPAIISGVSTYQQSPLKEEPWRRGEWNINSRRTGLIARKIGVYPMWTKDGKRVLSTLLHVVDNHVIKYLSPEEYGKTRMGQKRYKGKSKFGCVVVGAESGDPQLFTKEYCGLFGSSGVMPKKKLTTFLVSPEAALQPGTPLYASHFQVDDYVDVFGITIDYGFQGVVKRWGFKGGPASHGNTKFHRRPGCVGGGGEKGRVWPGTKMPGHMGSERRTLRGCQVLRVNSKYNVIWVLGPAIPGDTNSFCYIYDTFLPLRRFKRTVAPPFPTYYLEDEKELPDDVYSKDIHVFSDPSVEFVEHKN